MPAISQFSTEATSLDADDYIGIDQKVGDLYQTKKIKKGAVVTSIQADLGWVQVTTVANLRAETSSGRSLKRAWLTAPGDRAAREWYFDAASSVADDGTDSTVAVKPADIDSGDPGRWLPW